MNKELQYEFVLQIHRVYLVIDFPCNVQIWWRKGKGKIMTQKPIPIMGKEQYFDVNEPLSIRGNCHLRNGFFSPKISQIQIVLIPADTTLKSGGSVQLDMASILNPSFLNRPTSLRFEKELTGIPRASTAKISFTLSAHFLKECSNTSSQDISFQDASLRRPKDLIIRDNMSVGGKIIGYKDQPSHQFKSSKHIASPDTTEYNSNTTFYNNNVSFNINNISKDSVDFKDVTFRSPERPHQEQKTQYKDYRRIENSRTPEYGTYNTKVQIKHQYKNNEPKKQYYANDYGSKFAQPPVRPLEFSFNPVDNTERDKEKKEQLNIINELNKQLEEAKREIQRLKINPQTQTPLHLINQLNSVGAQSEQLKRERTELMAQLNRNREEIAQLKNALQNAKTEMIEESKRTAFTFQQRNKDTIQRNEGMARELQERNKQIEQRQKEAEGRQRQIEAKAREIEELKKQGFKKQAQLLAFEEKLESEGGGRQWQDKYKKLQCEIERERELMRNRQKQQQTLLHEIEKQMSLMRVGKEEVTLLRDKLSSACRKIDELTARELTEQELAKQKHKEYQDIVGKLKIQIKNRDTVIEQAKLYVREKEQEVEQRDAFIVRAKQYIQSKEVEFQNERVMWQKSSSDQRVEDLEMYCENLQEKLNISHDEIEELVRKTRSQQETLEDLVKKNLEFQIQLNVKDIQIEALKKRTAL